MEPIEFDRMSTDELWSLHIELARLLEERIKREKMALDERLRMLNAPSPVRRYYPPVAAKYQNPDRPSETWSGRGKQPRWLVAQIKSGKRIDEFRIKNRNKKR